MSSRAVSNRAVDIELCLIELCLIDNRDWIKVSRVRDRVRVSRVRVSRARDQVRDLGLQAGAAGEGNSTGLQAGVGL